MNESLSSKFGFLVLLGHNSNFCYKEVMNLNIKLLSLALFTSCALYSEVLQVTVTWDPLLCQAGCMEGLNQRLLMISGVQNTQFNEANGMVTIQWKPTVPFRFTPINWALRYIGIRESTVLVKVKGTIHSDGKGFWVISDGDRTKFELINRVYSDPNEYVVQYNAANRELSRGLRDSLKEFEHRHQDVFVTGRLFMPQRSPPNALMIIIDQVNSVDQKEKTPSSYKPPVPDRTVTY